MGALAGRDVLLVVDNLEHLLEATDTLVDLLTDAPRLTMLVTSRSPLRVSAEHIYAVGPLELPPDGATSPSRRRVRSGAVRAAGRPRCGRASCSPARMRHPSSGSAARWTASRWRWSSRRPASARSPPAQILERLDSALDACSSVARGTCPSVSAALQQHHPVERRPPLPRRPRGPRHAFGLRGQLQPRLCRGSADGRPGRRDPLGALETLVDASLIGSSDRQGVTTFRLPLPRSGIRRRAALAGAVIHRPRCLAEPSYRELARQAQPGLRGPEQLEWIAALERETAEPRSRHPRAASTTATSRRPRELVVALPLSLDRRLSGRGADLVRRAARHRPA